MVVLDVCYDRKSSAVFGYSLLTKFPSTGMTSAIDTIPSTLDLSLVVGVAAFVSVDFRLHGARVCF